MNQLDVKKMRIVCGTMMGSLGLYLIGLSFLITEQYEQYKLQGFHLAMLSILFTFGLLAISVTLPKKEAKRQKDSGLLQRANPEEIEQAVTTVVVLQIVFLSAIGIFGCVMSYFAQSWSYALIMGTISTAALAFVFPTVEKVKYLYDIK